MLIHVCSPALGRDNISVNKKMCLLSPVAHHQCAYNFAASPLLLTTFMPFNVSYVTSFGYDMMVWQNL